MPLNQKMYLKHVVTSAFLEILSITGKGLINSKPCPQNPKLRTPAHIEEKIVHLRRKYHLGQQRISCYPERYHDMKISSSDVYSVL